MPKTIPHRELRNNSSAVLREVQAGEQIQITNHGEVVAVLSPPDQAVGTAIRIRRAAVHGGFASLPRVQLDHPVQNSLDELRDER